MMLSKSGAMGTNSTAITWVTDHQQIDIPAGKGGCLKAIALQYRAPEESILDSGALVRLRNSSADWDPLYLLTGQGSIITAGADAKEVMTYPVEKELPGNSTVSLDVLQYDNQSTQFAATLLWEYGGKPKKETFVGYIHPLKAGAVSATTRASPGYYDIPGGKGGRVTNLYHMAWGTMETAVQDGGFVEVENNAYDMTPCHAYVDAVGGIGAAGSGMKHPNKIPWDCPCPQNSRFTTYVSADSD